MKTTIKVTYNLKGTSLKKSQKIDEEIMKKIESIGGEWYAQGFGRDDVRDICFDLEIK